MRKFLTDLFTGADNKSFDLAKVLLTSGLGVYLFGGAMAGWHGTINWIEFGGGFGLMMGGGAAHSKFTPQPPCPPDAPGEAA